MSSTKKQRQKKSSERIIPIQIEGSESETENVSDSSEAKNKNINKVIKDTKESGDSIISTELSEDTATTSISRIELCDTKVSSNVQEQEIDIKLPERMLPPYNVPEKLIIILDRAEDEISTSFEFPNGTKLKPLNMLKTTLKFFLNTKSSFDSKHEFALMTLNENSTTWVHGFTNNIETIIDEINDVEECQTEDIFDMSTVFNLINEKIDVPRPKSDLIIPPPFVVRAIFLYSRSITMPQIKLTEEINNLLESPYFTFDVAMTHEVPDSSNKCNLIFKELQQLDTKGFAYFFPISRDVSMMHVAMAKLLSHPLQRCSQKYANYTLN